MKDEDWEALEAHQALPPYAHDLTSLRTRSYLQCTHTSHQVLSPYAHPPYAHAVLTWTAVVPQTMEDLKVDSEKKSQKPAPKSAASSEVEYKGGGKRRLLPYGKGRIGPPKELTPDHPYYAEYKEWMDMTKELEQGTGVQISHYICLGAMGRACYEMSGSELAGSVLCDIRDLGTVMHGPGVGRTGP
eukprot:1003003-Rhodomonas_salina.1